MPYPKTTQRRKTVGLFVDFLNIKKIDYKSIEHLAKKHSKVKPFLQRFDESDALEMVLETHIELNGYVNKLIADPWKNIDEAENIVEWVSGVNPPGYNVGESDLKIHMYDENQIDETLFDHILAVDLLEVFSQVPFSHLKICRQCSKYFLAEKSNTHFCSSKCMKDNDRQNNSKKYTKIAKSRRIKGKYIPKSYFRCEACKKKIDKPRLLWQDQFMKQSIECPHCHETVPNGFYSKK